MEAAEYLYEVQEMDTTVASPVWRRIAQFTEYWRATHFIWGEERANKRIEVEGLQVRLVAVRTHTIVHKHSCWGGPHLACIAGRLGQEIGAAVERLWLAGETEPTRSKPEGWRDSITCGLCASTPAVQA